MGQGAGGGVQSGRSCGSSGTGGPNGNAIRLRNSADDAKDAMGPLTVRLGSWLLAGNCRSWAPTPSGAPSPGASYPSSVVQGHLPRARKPTRIPYPDLSCGGEGAGWGLSDRIGLDRCLLVTERGPLDEMPGKVAEHCRRRQGDRGHLIA
jgi:hypothetical protein